MNTLYLKQEKEEWILRSYDLKHSTLINILGVFDNIINETYARADLKIKLLKITSNDIVKYHYVFRYDNNIIINNMY